MKKRVLSILTTGFLALSVTGVADATTTCQENFSQSPNFTLSPDSSTIPDSIAIKNKRGEKYA